MVRCVEYGNLGAAVPLERLLAAPRKSKTEAPNHFRAGAFVIIRIGGFAWSGLHPRKESPRPSLFGRCFARPLHELCWLPIERDEFMLGLVSGKRGGRLPVWSCTEAGGYLVLQEGANDGRRHDPFRPVHSTVPAAGACHLAIQLRQPLVRDKEIAALRICYGS